MEINVNIRLSAEPELTRTLETIANAVAAIKICTMAEDDPDIGKKLSAPVKETKAPEPTKAKKAEPVKVDPAKAETAKEEPADDKTAPETPTNNPNDIVKKTELPKFRELVAAYCNKVGEEQGKANVKKWLTDNGFGGLSKLTYAGADNLVAFLGVEVKDDA